MSTRALALATTCAALLGAACSSDATPAAAPTTASPTGTAPTAPASPTTVSPSAAPVPAASPTPEPKPPAASFLTGVRRDRNGRVLVVKIDNSPAARPHTGISAADVVYVEPVEHGITRLAAVFSSTLPRTVGPVRSARITDLELFAQYGRVAFAYSGAQRKLKPSIRRANLVEVVANKAVNDPGRGYFRSPRRSPPVNLYASPPTLLDRAPKAQQARDVGFRFGPAIPGGRPATSASTSFASARVGFVWSPDAKRWRWVMDGAPGRDSDGTRVEASTVVFQYVKTERSRYFDFTGANTPYARTVGSGSALVLRDGTAQSVRWSRADQDSPTVFTAAKRRVTFAPGKVWVVLVRAGGQVSVS